MIGTTLKRETNNYKLWVVKSNDIIYEHYRKIPLEKCEICNINVRVYRHHLYPKEFFGQCAPLRENFVMLCAKCHGRIHTVLSLFKKIRPWTKNDCLLAVKIVHYKFNCPSKSSISYLRLIREVEEKYNIENKYAEFNPDDIYNPLNGVLK